MFGSIVNKFKICFVLYEEFPDTGPVRLAYAKELVRNGHSVTIITYLSKDQDVFQSIDGVNIIRFPISQKPFSKIGMLVFLSKALRFINAKNFNIVHIFNTCPYFGSLVLFGPKSSKYLYHTMSHPLSDSGLRIWFRKEFIALNMKLMSGVLFLSTELKDHLCKNRRLNNTDIVPPGYDKNIFYPKPNSERYQLRHSKFKLNNNQLVLVFAGVLSRLRALENLIKAFFLVKRIVPEAVLWLIGDGDSKKTLEYLVKKYKIEESVFFLGRVPHEQLPAYYNAADIGLAYIPIVDMYTYNPPLKTIEYLACGLPVVATRTVSNSKIIYTKKNGLLVGDQPEEFAAGILKLLTNKKLLQSMRDKSDLISFYEISNLVKNKIIPFYERIYK